MTALLALLLPGLSALGDSLSAADLSLCCNALYCPMHHRQMSDTRKDKSNCSAMSVPGQKDCSMGACDASPNPVIGTAVYVLIVPVTLSAPAIAEAAPALLPKFFLYVAKPPLTPPPRTSLS